MADTADTAQQTEQTAEQGKAPKFDGEFDAERAARLVENLRKEVETLKADKETLSASLQEREDADKSDAQKTADALDAAKKAAADAQRLLYVERAARKHSLPDDLVEFLTGETEEEISDKAERLAKYRPSDDGSPSEDSSEEPAPAGVAPQRPTPTLTPGHGGEAPQPFDAAAIAKAVR